MDYDWRKDSYESWCLAIYWIALTRGFVRPKTCWELYVCEAAGVIP